MPPILQVIFTAVGNDPAKFVEAGKAFLRLLGLLGENEELSPEDRLKLEEACSDLYHKVNERANQVAAGGSEPSSPSPSP